MTVARLWLLIWESTVLSLPAGTLGHRYSKTLDSSEARPPLGELRYPNCGGWDSPVSLGAHGIPLGRQLGRPQAGQLGGVPQCVRKWSLTDPFLSKATCGHMGL